MERVQSSKKAKKAGVSAANAGGGGAYMDTVPYGTTLVLPSVIKFDFIQVVSLGKNQHNVLLLLSKWMTHEKINSTFAG